MSNSLKISIVDDNKFFREGLRFFIESETEWTITQEEESGLSLIDKGFLIIPDIVLMDINMPKLNGIETTFNLLNGYSRTEIKFIAITLHSDRYHIEALIKAGFRGCILKKDVYSELKQAVEKVHTNGLYFKHASVRKLQNKL
nr:response regulator transcription factor [uncultured Carboxylicivirga sp.]